jgi:hypothetical protein
MAMSERLSDLEERRARRATNALWVVINAVKQQTEPSVWIKMGLFDLIDLADALNRGGEHPALKLWLERKSGTNRPAPSLQEKRARRLAVLLCIALHGVGLSKPNARQTAAKALAETGLFARGPTVGSLRHWEARMAPPLLTPEDERAIARATASCGNDPQRLVNHFMGLVQLLPNQLIPSRPA